MHTDKFGTVILSADELVEGLYTGKIKHFTDIFVDDKTADQFNQAINTNKDHIDKLSAYKEPDQFDSIEMFDEANQCDWFMPKDAVHENLLEMLYGMCETEVQRKRVDEELELFIQHGMFDLLFYLKYLVDTMRENNIVWGVGRGSSVASYVLFLIGVHKIDSIKYDLDIKEFLK